MLEDIRSGKIPVPGPVDIVNIIEAAIRDLVNLEERLETIEKKIVVCPRCIHCKKTAKESGRALFLINAAGQYYQCYPELCPENTNKRLPDGSKQGEK